MNRRQIIQETIKELLEKMDFEGDVEIEESGQDVLIVKIQSEEAGFLIGQGGENLAAIQQLARAIVNRRLVPDAVSFIIDVNDYRGHRLELLRETALKLASQARQEYCSKTLEPLPPYERRFIHLVLRDFQGVKTESQGEGDMRRVVIKPSDNGNCGIATRN